MLGEGSLLYNKRIINKERTRETQELDQELKIEGAGRNKCQSDFLAGEADRVGVLGTSIRISGTIVLV